MLGKVSNVTCVMIKLGLPVLSQLIIPTFFLILILRYWENAHP